ncbi:MAG: PAS domain S-box protein, partial [Proteobacteria bacterium]|nr:PAS domain S-box protein [Pseudomonadota bacterium]
MNPEPINILLIEDNPGDARLIRELLTEAGTAMFTLEWVDQLSTGLKRLANGGVDLILLDLGLPDSQGFDTFTRTYDQGRHLPIVVLTGNSDETLAVKAMQAGAQDYLIKGKVDGNLLIRVMRYAIERKGLEKVLQKSHQELERRVAERTSELSRVNVELRTEIAEHKQAEKMLKESEKRFRQVAENSKEWIWEVDALGLYTYASPVVEKILGYTSEEIVGKKHFYDLFHPEEREQIKKAAFEMFAMKKPFREFINLNCHKKGDTVWLLTSGVPIIDRKGKLVGYRGVDADITEHKEARDELQKEKEKFRVLTEESPLGVSLIDEEGEYKYVNRKFVEMFGYSLKEIPTGREWFAKAYPDDEYRNQAISAWITAVKETKVGQTSPLIYTVTCKDGSKKLIQFLPVKMNTGDQIIIYEDITAQRKMEAQLLQSQKMEAVGRLAGGVAHDFNNILTVINNLSQLALMTLKKADPLRKDLEEIKKAGDRAASLTRQLLAFSRKQVLQPRVLDLNRVIIDMNNMIKRLIGEDVEMKTILTPELGRVKADSGQIEQVIMNLVINARDAMPGGGKITIETASMHLDEAYAGEHGVELKPGPHVMLGISDTGIGMDKETRSHIFEPFFTTKEKDR